MELEAQVFEARRSRARQSWREDSLKAEFPAAEERDQRGEIGGGTARAVYGVESMEGKGVPGKA